MKNKAVRASTFLLILGVGHWAGASEPSVIALPIAINLDPLFQAAERNIPKVPPGVETWTPLPGKGSQVYRFNLYRDPLALYLSGNRLTLRTSVNYWMEVGIKVGGFVKSMGSCGLGPDGFRRATLGGQAEFAINPHWGVDLRVTPFEPMAANSCAITFLGYDITYKVLGGMKDAMGRGVTGLEQQVRDSAFLRQRVEEVWRTAQQPVEVSPGVFLCLNPERLRLGPWSSQGRTLVAMPEIQARPSLHLGTRPEVQLRPLPDLEYIKDSLSPSFNLQVDAELGFREATEQLRRQLAGKVFESEKGRFEIRDVLVRGKGTQAILEVQLKGKIDGRLALAGTPLFNPVTGCLEIRDLDYTLESRSWITHVGEWLFRSTLRKTLADKANWFVKKNFKDLQEQVQRGLNRELVPGVTMQGKLDRLILDQPLILEDRFRVLAHLDGQVQIFMKPHGS